MTSTLHLPARWLFVSLAVLLLGLAACSDGDSAGSRVPNPNSTATRTGVTEPTATPPPPTPTPEPTEHRSIRATRLVIPSLNIAVPVSTSRVIRFAPTNAGPPGCPPYKQEYDTTLETPSSGVTTAGENLEDLANRVHIYGHSRWLGVAGVFLKLQDINAGDEVIVDGVDRDTGEQYTDLRFRVSALYIGDVDSGSDLLSGDPPKRPRVILQTSAREDGRGKQWILDRDKVLSKATNTVEGDLNDPCKYLTLYVIAEPTWSP